MDGERIERKFLQDNGLFAVCSNCKKMRDIEGSWHQISQEVLDSMLASEKVTHSLCSQCRKILYPGL